MTKSDWMDLAVLERRKYNLLSETMGLSRQIGEAMDRGDDVSLRMLLSMRQEPILGLGEVKNAVRSKREALSSQELERLSDLESGAQPQEGEERTYCDEFGRARRLLEQVLELDRKLNRRLTGKDSCYTAEK